MIIENSLEEKEQLLGEPDEAEGREEEEVSMGGVAGATTPLGTGPNYPSKPTRSKKLRSPLETGAASFGGARVVRKK